MDDFGFVPENPQTEQTTNVETVVMTVKIKPTLADMRHDLHTLTDALVIAPRADRKLTKDVISVIKNTTKIERRRDLEAKKTSMPTQIYDIEDLRLEIECKPDNSNRYHYEHPRIITVINRKTKKIMDRVTKPFLVLRIASTVYEKEAQIEKSKKILEAANKSFQDIYEAQKQVQK